MVVLETSPPLTAAVGLYDLEESHSGKMVNKRFINLHNWLGPVCVKQMKESMVGNEKILLSSGKMVFFLGGGGVST